MDAPRDTLPESFSVREWIGIARSLALYYGIPGRAAQLRRFYAQFVPAGSLCFDIGAHVGNRTRALRALGARVVVVEPQPLCLRVLRQLFGHDSQVAIVASALGASTGQARLFADAGNPTVTTLSQDWIAQVMQDPGFKRVSWQAGPLVSIDTLQALIDQHGEPAFVKIDVEGFEAEILRGLQTPLRCLSFEYLPASHETGLECLDLLAKLGRYEYNRSVGEQHRFVSESWCHTDTMRDFLSGLSPSDGSGDIYARLVPIATPKNLQQGR